MRTNGFFYQPKNREIEQIFTRLIRHPVVKVSDRRVSQDIARNKTIRYLSSKDNIWIRQGIIALPENVKLRRNGTGFDFYFKL